MNAFADTWREIYINGEKRRATMSRAPDIVKDFDGVFFTDSPTLPFTRCVQHQLRRGATTHLESGGRIRTSGNWYSLSPDNERGVVTI